MFIRHLNTQLWIVLHLSDFVMFRKRFYNQSGGSIGLAQLWNTLEDEIWKIPSSHINKQNLFYGHGWMILWHIIQFFYTWSRVVYIPSLKWVTEIQYVNTSDLINTNFKHCHTRVFSDHVLDKLLFFKEKILDLYVWLTYISVWEVEIM